MNFSNDRKEILFDEITKDWEHMDEVEKYKKFLRQECSFENPNNNYIVERFQLEVRAQLNKNVKNLLP